MYFKHNSSPISPLCLNLNYNLLYMSPYTSMVSSHVEFVPHRTSTWSSTWLLWGPPHPWGCSNYNMGLGWPEGESSPQLQVVCGYGFFVHCTCTVHPCKAMLAMVAPSHVLGPMAMLCKLVQVHIWAHNLWSRWSIPHWGQHKWLASLSMWPCYGRFQLYLEFWPLDLIILISSCYNLHVMQKIILSYRNGI